MVKKKSSDQNEISQNDHSETPDNKEDKNTPGSEGNLTDENLPLESPEQDTAEEAKGETAVTDKVVTEEKTAEEKLAEMQDKYLRLSAEFDNYRKRTLREKIELSKYASEELLLKILPVMDDFERALSHMDKGSDSIALKEGIDLIYQKFTDFLKQNGVREIDSLNCDFNVDLHDAVAKTPVEEADKKGKIVDVVQKGYYLMDKVIRHSKVVIGE